MSIIWEYRALHETAYSRRARLIVELLDPVTLDPVYDGVRLKVKGLVAMPIVSSSGRFIWFDEKGATPLQLEIDTGTLPYSWPRELDVPPLPPPPPPPALPVTHTFLRRELGPSTAYPFNTVGVTGLRGTLIRNVADDPPVRLADADVRLQWIDDNQAGLVWVDAPTVTRTNGNGDFVAIVRLATSQIARPDAQQRMRVRVAATRSGATRFSAELPIDFGQISHAPQKFAWDTLQP